VNAAYSKSICIDDMFLSVRDQMEGMITEVQTPQMMRATHDELESYGETAGRELARRLVQAQLDLRAAQERPVTVKGEDGVPRPYRRESRRPLGTVLGEVMVTRLAYQAAGVSGLHPLDALLNLPSELYSFGIRRRVAKHAAISSFDEVVEDLRTATGAHVGKRQVEELAVRAAVDFDAFYFERRTANDNDLMEDTDDLLVLTVDGKGIVVVPNDLRPATKKAARKAVRKLVTRLLPGEKRNRKRMAEVAAIYTVPAFPRTPLDVLADLDNDDRERPLRPAVRNKRVLASVEKSAADVIEEAFRDANARDPQHRRRWVVLLDGNKDQLAFVKAAAKTLGVKVTIVVDLMHVLEYLWEAAHVFCGKSTPEAEAWVQQRLLWLLQGRPAGKIATAMRQWARTMKLRGAALKTVRESARYLANHARYMRYGDAIHQGLPIATGVIEGACRYLVKDRMDRGGARWTLTGAEAVLRLRALRASGDFDAYWAFHLRNELARNHVSHYADARLPDPMRGLRRVK